MYIQHNQSAKAAYQTNQERITALIEQFIGQNPAIPYKKVFHAEEEYPYDHDGKVTVDLSALFAEVEVGTRIVSKTAIFAEYDRMMGIEIACYGPTTCFVAGEIVYQSNPDLENLREFQTFTCHLERGANELVIITEKTTMGLGYIIGASRPQWDPVHFFRPDQLNQLGFLHGIATTGVLDEKIGSTIWRTPKKEFSLNAGSYFFARLEDETNIFKGTWQELPEHWKKQADLLFYGPIEAERPVPASLLAVLEYSQDNFWRRVSDGAYLRYFSNSDLYARCFYPMGVTLYGFLRAAEHYQNPRWMDYVSGFVDQIVTFDQYAAWDLATFNYTGVNTQYYWLEELDDCGSFGSLLLESYQQGEAEKKAMADHIREYMRSGQRRESDGAFSRHNDTMWIDDLYMSVPFLARYGSLFADQTAFDDAALQFKLFKRRMFMSDNYLMSHIYDTSQQVANRIPWSRGNGWVLFSLTELLDRLPSDHVDREELIQFYNQMIEGILACMDETGLWHQVLDEKDSYLESSATAMFICSMSRGLRHDYLTADKVIEVEQCMTRAWDGLMTECVDKLGNLYGVCQGSGFSFSKNYYQELGWLLNDSHGIGIVVLAGIEYMTTMNQTKQN